MANIFLTKETLKEAVALWCNNSFSGEEQYGNISDWDVSEITDMSDIFSDFATFNDDISRWDVSKVTNMVGTFTGARAFNQPIGNWDVSKVTNMQEMFAGALAFNQPIGDWDVSKVTNMQDMFEWAKAFNQRIGHWDVSKVTNMKGMFHYAYEFDQPIGMWDVSKVTNMQDMFCEAKAFNQPIGDWDVSKVTNMSTMFQDAYEFNQPIIKWNVSNVTDMSWMFVLTESSDQPIGFNQPIGDWNVSNVTNMEQMFAGVTAFNQDIRNWNVSNVTNMEDMFLEADAMRHDNRPPAPPPIFRPATPDMPPPVNDYNSIAATPLEESSAILDINAAAVDVIDTGESFNVKTYLEANSRKQNIAFKVGNAYSICTKDDIIDNCINNESNIIFGCSYEDTSIVPRAQNVIRDIPYINPRCFGILVGLFRLSDIKTVLRDPTIRCIEVGDYPTENGVRALNPRPVKELVTVTSLSMLGRNPNALGALHCQAGQKMQVYSLRKMAFPPATVPPVPTVLAATVPPVPPVPPVPTVLAVPAPWWRRFGLGNRRGGSKQTRRIKRESKRKHSRKGKHSIKHKQTKKRGVRKTRRG